ncbi:hypothetical protein [Kitasatospora purpeofusca]|uniref:hypothetical protein n=1 Tax=Kitasatospora purpeofusca TaxID=67352 RepID=UPI00368A3C53
MTRSGGNHLAALVAAAKQAEAADTAKAEADALTLAPVSGPVEYRVSSEPGFAPRGVALCNGAADPDALTAKPTCEWRSGAELVDMATLNRLMVEHFKEAGHSGFSRTVGDSVTVTGLILGSK